MALNIHDALEIVKRAGFGPDDKINTGERRMLGGEHLTNPDTLDEALDRAEYHRNPQNMTLEQLTDIDDL